MALSSEASWALTYFEQRGRGGGRRGHNHRVELIGSVSRRNNPASILPLDGLHGRVCLQRLRGKPGHQCLRELLHSSFERGENWRRWLRNV